MDKRQKDQPSDMTERITMPPSWCSSICKNAMGQLCLEHCAIRRDTSGFQIKPGTRLVDMPKFPKTDGMTRDEKFTSVVIYLSKIVEHLQGEENEYISPIPRRRSNSHTSTGRGVSPAIPIQNILHDLTPTATTLEAGEERKGEDVRSSEVAQPAD